MPLLELLTPDLRLGSVFEIGTELLRRHGIRALLLDLDCTLKHHYSDELLPGVEHWVGQMHRDGVRLCILSNGRSQRIRPLADRLGLVCIGGAAKPLPFALRAALRRLEVEPDRAAIVGDQVFTDVLAGRLAGIFTILVPPPGSDEPWITRVKRPWERRVLRRIAVRQGCQLARWSPGRLTL